LVGYPSLLEDLGLPAALRQLAATFHFYHGIEVSLSIDDIRGLLHRWRRQISIEKSRNPLPISPNTLMLPRYSSGEENWMGEVL
jgi:hypothetical protein